MVSLKQELVATISIRGPARFGRINFVGSTEPGLTREDRFYPTNKVDWVEWIRFPVKPPPDGAESLIAMGRRCAREISFLVIFHRKINNFFAKAKK